MPLLNRLPRVRRCADDDSGACTLVEAAYGDAAFWHGGEAAGVPEVQASLVPDALQTVLNIRRTVTDRMAQKLPNVTYTVFNLYPVREEDAVEVAQCVETAAHAHFDSHIHVYRPSTFSTIVSCSRLLRLVELKALKTGNGATNRTEADCTEVVQRLLADAKTAPRVSARVTCDRRRSDARFDPSQLVPASDGRGVWCRCGISSPSLGPVRRMRRTTPTGRA